MNVITGVILIWALFSLWAYGRTLAYFQREFPTVRDRGDIGIALLVGVMGPIGLFIAKAHSDTNRHGVQFWPRKAARTDGGLMTLDEHQCPGCGHSCEVYPRERERDDWGCAYCGNHYRLSTGEIIPIGLGDDEPDWSKPDEAEVAWAQATMPGKASGHTIAWRRWSLRENMPTTLVDETTTRDMSQLSDAELCDRLAEIHREVVEARKEPAYVLVSGNGARWLPGQPMMGYRVADMPRAHGAGIYALKDDPGGGDVHGRVALWGPIVEHEHGYRARYAYPIELWCQNEEHADALSKAYGVPCHVVEHSPREVTLKMTISAADVRRLHEAIRRQSLDHPRIRHFRAGH